MNFSSDSVKHESKTQNEDFVFDLETPRGHFFAVIDFDSHDFANLNATLKGKLETIVIRLSHCPGSQRTCFSVSLPRKLIISSITCASRQGARNSSGAPYSVW